MRGRTSFRTPFPSLLARGAARRAAAVLATLGLLSGGIAAAATTATPFQLAYMYGTSGPASGGTPVNLVGNQFQSGATVTIGGISVGATVTSSTRIGVTTPSRAAGALYDVIVTNPGDAPAVLTKGWFADFTDVPQASPFHSPVETILRDGITGGCGGGNYCPNANITRGQMAVFLLRAGHGSGYIPPPATGTVFADVSQGTTFADWIEQLYAEGITGGCASNPLRYCPDSSVTRGQMAAFLLKIYHGAGYVPPAATGVFTDVPISMPLAPFIEEVGRLSITAGCGGTNYCPTNPRHARADGGLSGQDLPPQRGLAVPPAGDLGPERLRDQRRARRRIPALAGVPVFAGAVPLSEPASGARQRARRLQRLLPPGQLHGASPPHGVLPQRALRGGSAPPAGHVRPSQARSSCRRTPLRGRAISPRT